MVLFKGGAPAKSFLLCCLGARGGYCKGGGPRSGPKRYTFLDWTGKHAYKNNGIHTIHNAGGIRRVTNYLQITICLQLPIAYTLQIAYILQIAYKLKMVYKLQIAYKLNIAYKLQIVYTLQTASRACLQV